MEKFLKEMVAEASKMALDAFGKADIKYAKDFATDVVTQADLDINKFCIAKIKEAYPDHGIISEEDDALNSEAEYVWTIDPIDGTANFATSIPLFGVMLCLIKKGELEMAIISLPVMEEVFFAEKGKGAFVNGKKISCSEKTEIADTYAAVGSNIQPQKHFLVDFFDGLTEKNPMWRSAYGSAGVTAVYVGAGRRDWMMTMGAKIWDYAPAALILREAGCRVTNFAGDDWGVDDREILAANPVLHDKILQEVKKSKQEYEIKKK